MEGKVNWGGGGGGGGKVLFAFLFFSSSTLPKIALDTAFMSDKSEN